MHRLLVIDDDDGIRALFDRQFGPHYDIKFASSGQEAVQLLREEPLDLVISDLSLPDTNGIRILEESKSIDKYRPFIVITAFGTVESAVEAMKLGAMDYVSKPFRKGEMSVLIDKALKQRDNDLERKRLREWAAREYSFSSIIGKDPKMERLFEMVKRVADTSTTVLIQGESGTGKERFARAIHQNSHRRSKQFLGINCGALPEALLESELFGHVKGAFTGAVYTKKGLFEDATQGTILLDEISVISPAVQAKLLRVLQERELRPVGSNRSISIETRVIAATNDDLKRLVETGVFREDLYFRLSVIPLTIPPLRERRMDVKLLIEHFTKTIGERISVPYKAMSPSAMGACLDYSWPGNVRELENLIERLLLTVETDTIHWHHLPEELRGADPGPEPVPFDPGPSEFSVREQLARRRLELERQAILEALRQSDGNKSRAAKLLGISRGSLYNRIREIEENGYQVRL